MTTLPIIAVIGRPNVGKSTLVNRIAQSDEAIVHEARGVTRDRSYHKADWAGVPFMLIDTGGIEMSFDDKFQTSIKAQAEIAMQEASAIIFLVDGQVGLTPDDEAVAKLLKRSNKPVFVVVNKVDRPGSQEETYEFYNLGLGTPYPVSATHGNGTGDLLDEVIKVLPKVEEQEELDAISIATIGRPNAGKSSLVNKLTGLDRSIVSDVAGTTRDTIDSLVEIDGKRYRFIDTAGIRRKSLIDEDVEYYGFVRAMRAIDECDVALLVIDSTVGLTDQDQRVANYALERGCAIVVALNKWDLMKERPEEREELNRLVEDRLIFISWAPVVRISALTGKSTHKVIEAIDRAYASYTKEISTSALNRFLTELREFGHTINKRGKNLRINYVTQTGQRPPRFTFFANFPQIIDDTYERYLENRLREKFNLEGTPVVMKFKSKDT